MSLLTDNLVQSTEPPVEVAGTVNEITQHAETVHTVKTFSFPEYQSVLGKKKYEPAFIPLTDDEIRSFTIAKLSELKAEKMSQSMQKMAFDMLGQQKSQLENAFSSFGAVMHSMTFSMSQYILTLLILQPIPLSLLKVRSLVLK
jgi:hypothetical protein